MPMQGNQFSVELMLHQAQRMIQQVMDAHGGIRRAARPGNPQHLCHNRIDALQFAPDDLGEFRVPALLRQQVNECLDGHHAVLDFVCQARRERAQAGQPVQPPEILFENRRGSQSVQNHDYFSRLARFDGQNTRMQRRRPAQRNFAVQNCLAAPGRFLNQPGQRCGQRTQGRIQQLRRVPLQMFGGFRGAGDDALARTDHEHAAGKTFLKKTQGISARKSAGPFGQLVR